MANYTIAGQVSAIQWTGSNLSALPTAFGAGWDFFTSTNDTGLYVVQHGAESYSARYVPVNNWMVSQTAYGTSTPSLNGGFSILDNATFTQQYTAA